LKGLQTLAADGEQDSLDILKEELDEFGVEFNGASTCEEGIRRLASLTYDLATLDLMGVRGFDLLEYASAKQIPVAMLTAHAFSPQSLKKSVELGARAYLPKDQLRQIAPFSRRCPDSELSVSLGSAFGKHFGPDRRKSEKIFGRNSRRISRSMSPRLLNHDPSAFSPQKISGGLL
jgi:CheY-like chemotaxis protein